MVTQGPGCKFLSWRSKEERLDQIWGWGVGHAWEFVLNFFKVTENEGSQLHLGRVSYIN